MESKQVNRKLSSLFWYILYAMPLIALLLDIVGNFFIYKGTGSAPNNSIISTSINDIVNVFDNFTIPFLKASFIDVFNLIGLDMSLEFTSIWVIILVWFVQFMLLHIIVDVLTFIFKVYHKLMEKVGF